MSKERAVLNCPSTLLPVPVPLAEVTSSAIPEIITMFQMAGAPGRLCWRAGACTMRRTGQRRGGASVRERL